MDNRIEVLDSTADLVQWNGEQRVSSELVAWRLDIEHRVLLHTMETYKAQIEEFGSVAFETRLRPSGGKPTRYALLNESQCHFVATLSRNSERVVKFKVWLVKAFGAVRESAHPAPAVPTNLRDALLLAAELEGQRQQLAAQVQEMAPAAQYADEVLTSVSDWTTLTIAKELGISAQRLNMELYALKVQYKNGDGVWVLYAQHAAKHYTRTRTHTYTNYRGETMTKIVTVWTEAGRRFIHELLNHRMEKERARMVPSMAN